MIDPTLTDPNISVHPAPPLPPDGELCQVQVTIRYATCDETNSSCRGTLLFNPYSPLTMTVSGDLVTVAHWVDEHLIASACAFAGDKYKQGRCVEGIKRALLRGRVAELGNIAIQIDRVLP